MTIPVPRLFRLEYYTPDGWKVGHAHLSLLDPGRYVRRLEERGKFGRAVELKTDAIGETGRVWEPRNLPKRSDLVPTDTFMYGLPDAQRRGACQWCNQLHGDPFDGSCLI
jgi:hypothetical protein